MRKDGGPAFPFQLGEWAMDNTGMSLRDFFAAAALTGLQISNTMAMISAKAPPLLLDRMVNFAYEIADAMLKEREKDDDTTSHGA